VHPLFRTPAFSTWVAGIVVAIPSGLFDIGTLADLSNIGTLFAFVLVSIGVIILRFREPERRRSFVVPGGRMKSKDAIRSALYGGAGGLGLLYAYYLLAHRPWEWFATALFVFPLISLLVWLWQVGYLIPALSVIFCFLLMAGLPIITWYRFVIWLVIGLVIYFLYSRHRSEFARSR
jgi:APA family basic amino acid/polyamine antiporter